MRPIHRSAKVSRFLIAILGVGATATATANVIGSDHQNFNPVAGSTEFVTVHSTDTLEQWQFNVGLFLNQATNTLPYKENDDQSRSKANDSLVGADILAGVGLLPRLEFGIAAPFIVSQNVDKDDTRGEFAERGNTELRAGLKGTIVKGGAVGVAAIASANLNRTKENPHTGATTAPIYNLELALDRRAGKSIWAFNVGYRFREPGEPIEGSLLEPIGPEALASLAFAYKITRPGSLIFEMFGSQVLEKVENETNRDLGTGEAILGYKHTFNPFVAAHAGFGSELMHGLSTPDWRLYLGVVATFGGDSEDKPVLAKAEKPRRKQRARRKPTQDPPAAFIPTEEPDETVVLHDINFEFDSDYRVMPGAFVELDRVAERLQREGFKTVVVEGHTDFMGSDEYNDDLSFRRASTVRRYMIKNFGLDETALIAVGYGERYPIATNDTEAGRLKNRRVEVKIFKD